MTILLSSKHCRMEKTLTAAVEEAVLTINLKVGKFEELHSMALPHTTETSSLTAVYTSISQTYSSLIVNCELRNRNALKQSISVALGFSSWNLEGEKRRLVLKASKTGFEIIVEFQRMAITTSSSIGLAWAAMVVI